MSITVKDAAGANVNIAGFAGQTGQILANQSLTLLQAAVMASKIWSYNLVAKGVASGGTVDIAITPEATKRWAIGIEVFASAGFEGWLYEGADITSGTAINEIAMDRGNITASGNSVVYAPTVNATGTELHHVMDSGGRRNVQDEDGGFILDPAKTYLWRVVAGNALDYMANIKLAELDTIA